jgi:pantoate--beta-alanine ligase
VEVVRRIPELRSAVSQWRREGARVGLVPTMGALHEGHLALVRRAKGDCDRTIVSIFVNPKQFGPGEDFTAYPRAESEDLEKLAREGADLGFLPPVGEVYPAGFATRVRVEGLSEPLCGASRPGHFDGVATVVAKFLIAASPDAAYFGEKDYQQLLIIRRVARDLDLDVDIIGVATVREPDGLALSSRNAYLSPAERWIAPELHSILERIASTLATEPEAVAREIAQGHADLSRAGLAVEYLEVRDAETLTPLRTEAASPARLFVAARLGRTRLIDNLPIPAAPRSP